MKRSQNVTACRNPRQARGTQPRSGILKPVYIFLGVFVASGTADLDFRNYEASTAHLKHRVEAGILTLLSNLWVRVSRKVGQLFTPASARGL